MYFFCFMWVEMVFVCGLPSEYNHFTELDKANANHTIISYILSYTFWFILWSFWENTLYGPFFKTLNDDATLCYAVIVTLRNTI